MTTHSEALELERLSTNPRSVSPDVFLSTARQVRQTLYWEKKDLASYVVVATHLLDTALANSKGTSETAQFFAARALGLSFDVASFTWAGWDEPGVTMTPALQAVGLEAAQLNFELAQRNELPDGVRVAAHLRARGAEAEETAKQVQTARSVFVRQQGQPSDSA